MDGEMNGEGRQLRSRFIIYSQSKSNDENKENEPINDDQREPKKPQKRNYEREQSSAHQSRPRTRGPDRNSVGLHIRYRVDNIPRKLTPGPPNDEYEPRPHLYIPGHGYPVADFEAIGFYVRNRADDSPPRLTPGFRNATGFYVRNRTEESPEARLRNADGSSVISSPPETTPKPSTDENPGISNPPETTPQSSTDANPEINDPFNFRLKPRNLSKRIKVTIPKDVYDDWCW